jgi:hypothetical protein
MGIARQFGRAQAQKSGSSAPAELQEAGWRLLTALEAAIAEMGVDGIGDAVGEVNVRLQNSAEIANHLSIDDVLTFCEARFGHHGLIVSYLAALHQRSVKRSCA